MIEQDVESYLKKRVKEAGGRTIKLGNFSGIPDRLVLLPEGRVYFIELKAPGKKARPLQLKRCRELKRLGFKAMVIDRKEDIDKWIIEEVIG